MLILVILFLIKICERSIEEGNIRFKKILEAFVNISIYLYIQLNLPQCIFGVLQNERNRKESERYINKVNDNTNNCHFLFINNERGKPQKK